MPQNSNDATATALLLGEIASEKLRLIKGGEIGNEQALQAVDEDPPFKLPSSWMWTRLGNITSYIQRGKSPKYADGDGVPVVSQKCVQWAGLDLSVCRLIMAESLCDYDERRFLRHGDLLWNSTGTGTIGRVVLVSSPPNRLVCDSHVTVVRCLKAVPEYIRIWLRTEEVYGKIESRAAGSTNQVELTSQMATNQVVPLPPLNEQHRIVAKVDELMALCDRLEAARGKREATRDRLTAASLARLNTPDPETFQADSRFALNVLPAITTRSDQIKQLRESILNLAVRGKLVPQHEDDESASKLLQVIATAKSKRKLQTSDARIKDEPNPSPASLQIDLPIGWVAQSFENLFLFIDYRGNTPPKTESGIPLITAKNIRMGRLNREPREFISEKTHKAWMTRGLPQMGDLFFTTEAPLANVCINNISEPFALAQRAICFQPYGPINTKFVMLALMSDVMQALIDRHATGMTAKGIKAANLKPLPIPIPPLAEQHRIVARVDELMAFCDQLEASLTRGEITRSRLLNALLHEALQPRHDNVIDFAEARQRLLEKREAVACRVVQRLSPTRGFGRLRAVKPLYWAEAHCGIALGGQWGRAELGPFDQWIYSFEARAASAGWFSVLEHGNGDKVTRAEYRPSAGLAVKAQAAAEALGNRATEFERVLSLMADLNTDDSEIVTTLYAAWNDLLLEGKAVTDALVIVEVREHWHPSKARFTPARLQTWLNWLRTNRLVPHGQGPNTRHQAELI